MDDILAVHVGNSPKHLKSDILDSGGLGYEFFTVIVPSSRISSRFFSTYSQTRYIFPFLKYEIEEEKEKKWKLRTF